MERRSPLVRFCIAVLVVMASFVSLFGPLSTSVAFAIPEEPPPVGGVGIPTAVTANIPEAAKSVYKNILTQITRALVIAFFNAAQLYVGRIAYEAANAIASGGKGQSAQFFTKDLGKHLEDVGKDALAEGIGSLSDSAFFQTIGFNLCKPSQSALLRIQLSLGGALPAGVVAPESQFTSARPRCEFTNIVSNWDSFYGSLSQGDVSKVIDASFDPNKSEIGASVSILNSLTLNTQSKQALQLKEREIGRGFKDVKGIISGNVKTPSEVVTEATKEEVVRKPGASQLQQTGSILGNAFKEGPIQLASYTASVFLNTLTSKFLKRIFEKGLVGAFADDTKLVFATNPDAIATAGATDARNANIDLKTPNLQKVAEYEIVAELGACPQTNRGLWNCAADDRLIQAIQGQGEQGSFTVREAMLPENDFLHPKWPLFHRSLVKENQDSGCRNKGYCAANLQKLRAARILPLGFELAANSDKNEELCRGASGCVTLGEVVNNFYNCNAEQERDKDHPWCHLIDPNWVITSVPQQCVLSGFSDNVLSSQLNQRREECQDIQTCLQRNNQGECVGGYGYCVAERTAYRFDAQECPARYASCRTYRSSTGQQTSYLRSALDYGECSAENAGCLWYAVERDPVLSTSTNVWAATFATGSRIYFDKTVAPCSATDEGCTKVFAVAPGQSALNLVLNPSFEGVESTGTPKILTAWRPKIVYQDPQVRGIGAVDGLQALTLKPFTIVAQPLRLSPQRLYTLSLYARKISGSPTFQAGLVQFKDKDLSDLRNQTPLSGRDFRSVGCIQAPNVGVRLLPAVTEDWQRYECSFLTAEGTNSGRLFFVGDQADPVLVDAVQLEEGEFATEYIEGIAPELASLTLKVPSDDLPCAGAPTDSKLCSAFNQVCRQSEAGCDGYKDVESGTPEIPAIVNRNDACPQSCVGYNEYRKQASSFDLVQEADPRLSDPNDKGVAYFIPSTAASCDQTEVGCEEFTNLESGAQGEKIAYFTYVRACEKPTGTNTKTFFSWEGADRSGYQLRTWAFVFEPGASVLAGEAIGGPKILMKRGPDLKLKASQDCNQTAWRAGLDPDCRQFYDADGNVFYRYYSQTILSSVDCASFRLNKSGADDCTKTGGSFNAAAAECVYRVFAPQSLACKAEARSCRAYAGSESGNVQNLLTQNFRSSVRPFSIGNLSKEAVLVGDSSLKLDQPQGGVVQTSVATSTRPQDLLRVTFWVKAPAAGANTALTLSAVNPNDQTQKTVAGIVRVTPDWQRLVVGPFNGWTGATSTIIAWSAATPILYLDEISIDRIPDVVFVKTDTWKTPQECDQSLEGAPQARAMLGCRTYQARDGQPYHLRQFSRLCRESAIGCREFIDTRNSNTVGDQTFVMGASTTTRPGARYLYLVDDPAKRCQPENASCRAFGRPNFTQDRLGLLPQTATTTPFTTVYFKDDLSRYNETLCRPSELFCAAFSAAGGTEYFRDPGEHACEYKDSVALTSLTAGIPNLPSGTYSGWFRKGTTQPCYPLKLEGGQQFQIMLNGDADYRGWGGLCPREMGECAEFRDPNDTTDPLHKAGKPYFFIYDPERFDTASCQGKVDVGRGCILLANQNDASRAYHVEASYKTYARNLSEPTTPVNCNTDVASNPLCLMKVCAADHKVRLIDKRGAVTWTRDLNWQGDEACQSDADCNTQTTSTILGPGGEPLTQEVTNALGKCNVTKNKKNDANLLLKVKLDRDCVQWLGCKSAETVLDPTTNKYRDVCTNLALCDKGTGIPGDIFCAHYVNRAATTTEPMFTRGAFLDTGRYASRAIGLGEKDYSGYAVPNAFQVPDLVTLKVGADTDGIGSLGNNRYRFALDYRLTAAVPIFFEEFPQGTKKFIPVLPPNNESAKLVSSMDPDPYARGLALAHPSFSLCRHVGTGQLGFYHRSEYIASLQTGKTIFCYLPVQPNSAGYDLFSLAEIFSSSTDPLHDPILNQAFPAPDCRAHPEPDSPFPTSFVTGWDFSKTPPQPTGRLADYANANTCEYGEDCACAYKRVDYRDAGVIKFYAPDSAHVLPGICQGGPRHGQSCLPEAIFKLPSSQNAQGGQNSNVQAASEANASQTCGPPEQGGRCVAFSKVEVVRGSFGQCLERDWTRNVGNDLSQHPCLVWQPTPILFGEKDTYHYQPTSGYLPPENSGQYYCLYARGSQVENARLLLDASKFSTLANQKDKNKPFYAGGMTKFSFDDDYTSSGSGGSSGGDAGGFLFDCADGNCAVVEGSITGEQCEETDDDQDDGDQEKDWTVVNLIQSGNYSHAYTETFYPLVNDSRVQMKSSDIGYIRMEPIDNPNGKGRLGCGYQEDWVDGLSAVDYDEADSVASADKEWRNKFLKQYSPVLTRGTEGFLQSPDGKQVFVVPCVGDAQKQCFTKFWEKGYQADGQSRFIGVQDANDGAKLLRTFQTINANPLSGSCSSDKPYFAIRAVFQAPAVIKGAEVQDSGLADITPAGANSPSYTLRGFWVSTCGGAQSHLHYMYMRLYIETAQVCERIAEVRSAASRQDAAFTDRVWKSGIFSEPVVGARYGSRYSPFSSILATGVPGKDPLFQTGAAMAGFSPLHPPTFLGSGILVHWAPRAVGQTQLPPYERDAWAYLRNLFARIYNVYTWDDEYGYASGSLVKVGGGEFSALKTYDLQDTSGPEKTNASIDVKSPLPAITDVTFGLYTPLYLGYKDPLGKMPELTKPETYNYISYYTPHPPRVAAPDIRSCTAPGQCAIQRTDMFSFDGQSDGVVNVTGGLHKGVIRFYGWAAHEQMPLRSLVVDWGDGIRQSLEDARLKNHKPLCFTQSECSDPVRGSGITCNTDADCPPGAGACRPLGNCNRQQNITCRIDADCTQGKQKDTCVIRTFFGNSAEACDQNYFEFNHAYACTGKGKLPSCAQERMAGQPVAGYMHGRCARDPDRACTTPADIQAKVLVNNCGAGDTCLPTLAQSGGCWDESTNSCRFTPRVYLEDNWGWCTGECRTAFKSGQMVDDPGTYVLHAYGGCYSWTQRGTKNPILMNTGTEPKNECKLDSGDDGKYPWIVYPGSLQLRSSGEINAENEQTLDTKNIPPPVPACETLAPVNGDCAKPCVLDNGVCVRPVLDRK